MACVLDSELRILSDQGSSVFAEMLEACLRSAGDLLKAEDAIEEAILSLRKFYSVFGPARLREGGCSRVLLP